MVKAPSLSWELCRKWEETEKYDLVIHFNLREDRVQKKQEMSDLFSTCEDEGDRAYIIKRVKECKGRGVLFILDGYDELTELPEHSMLIFKRKVFSEGLSVKVITAVLGAWC